MLPRNITHAYVHTTLIRTQGLLLFTNKKTHTYGIWDEKKDKIFCKMFVYRE
jgi:hypothetical protein